MPEFGGNYRIRPKQPIKSLCLCRNSKFIGQTCAQRLLSNEKIHLTPTLTICSSISLWVEICTVAHSKGSNFFFVDL